ncbi:MAG: response regulator [Methanoregula sp.]|jgi:CheY-like chemotaxis protein/DNA-binding PadR family transcriptional regulator
MSKILVVEDEAIILLQLEEILHTIGYIVAGLAASGEDAIEKARRLKPDLVLMDIVMPGKMNGIEAAKIINEELDIPVVFVTSYADDTIIEKAKSVKPYGYIVKPFNELVIKATIEVALFRKTSEQKERDMKKPTGMMPDGESQYLDLPEIKTVLLKDIFSDIILFLYTENNIKEPIFKFAIESGIKKGGRNFFSYSRSTVQKYFLKEIQKQELFTHRIKRNEIHTLLPILEKCTESVQESKAPGSLQILIDFSETEEFEDIIAVKKMIISKKEKGIPVSGIIAINIGMIDHTRIRLFAEGISKIIVSTGKETTLSFAHHTFPAESVSIVPQATIDDVVKKSLELVVLSLLDKPISGNDIVHEIHNRYNVLIPQARVYMLLYDLEQNGYMEIKMSGKSKLYCPTEKGRKYISQKLNDIKLVFKHILGGGIDEITGIRDKN